VPSRVPLRKELKCVLVLIALITPESKLKPSQVEIASIGTNCIQITNIGHLRRIIAVITLRNRTFLSLSVIYLLQYGSIANQSIRRILNGAMVPNVRTTEVSKQRQKVVLHVKTGIC
jgi:hypothetical protein